LDKSFLSSASQLSIKDGMNAGTQILDVFILFLNPIDKLSIHYRFTAVWRNFTTTLYLILCPIFDDFIIIVLDVTHELL
jgi:hypothetical protein